MEHVDHRWVTLNDLLVPFEPPPDVEYPSPFIPLESGASATRAQALLARANYVVINAKCPKRPIILRHLNGFVRRAQRKDEQLFVREEPLSASAVSGP